jgi:hypothetical protein
MHFEDGCLDEGLVAQIGLRTDFPLPRADLPHGFCLGYAKSCESVEDRGADLDFRHLPIKVPR